VVAAYNAALPPPSRIRYSATAPDGTTVATYANRGLTHAVEVLQAKAGGRVRNVRAGGAAGKALMARHVGHTLTHELEEGSVLSEIAEPAPPSVSPRPRLPHQRPFAGDSGASEDWGWQARHPHLVQERSPWDDDDAAPARVQAEWVPAHGHERYAPALRLSDRVAKFVKWADQRKLSRSSVLDSTFTLRIFEEIVGDKLLRDITTDDLDLFLDALSAWPPNASKRRIFRNMLAPQVVIKARTLRVSGLNLRTQQKHIDRMRTFFRWLERRDEIRPGLLRGVRVATKHQIIGSHRSPFSNDQIKLIFDKLRAERPTATWKFWAPLFGLYQGMRVTEIAQLYVDDLYAVEGRWYLEISDGRPGQRVKNRHSRRSLPVHPIIVACGLPLLVAQAKRWGMPTLFPDVTWGFNGPGDCISDWWNRTHLRKRCGIDSKSLTFHSFRHTFATLGEESGVRDTRLAMMLGHAADQSVLRTHYVKMPMPDRLMPDLLAIQFPPLDHGVYDPVPFESVFRAAQAELSRQQRLDMVYGLAGPQAAGVIQRKAPTTWVPVHQAVP